MVESGSGFIMLTENLLKSFFLNKQTHNGLNPLSLIPKLNLGRTWKVLNPLDLKRLFCLWSLQLGFTYRCDLTIGMV